MDYSAFTQAEREGWHDRAARYGFFTALATLQLVPAMLEALRLRPGMRLLDLACGPGYVAGAASALEVDVQGVDYAQGMIDAAHKRFPSLTFEVGDAEDLRFLDHSFDAIGCNMGLFHMGDPQRAMSEAARVLRPEGRFCFSQCCAPSESTLYSILFSALRDIADLSRADPAPDAYALSCPDHVSEMMSEAGFKQIETRKIDSVLLASGDDFFDFFMQFGVRVPLIVNAQDADVQAALKDRINTDMAAYRTQTGFEVPMPSLLFTGVSQ